MKTIRTNICLGFLAIFVAFMSGCLGSSDFSISFSLEQANKAITDTYNVIKITGNCTYTEAFFDDNPTSGYAENITWTWTSKPANASEPTLTEITNSSGNSVFAFIPDAAGPYTLSANIECSIETYSDGTKSGSDLAEITFEVYDDEVQITSQSVLTEEEGDALRKTYLELPSNLVDADNCASRRYEYNFDSDGTNEILTHPKCFTNEVWLISEEGPQIDSDIIESDVELNDIDYFYSFLGIYTGGDGTLKIYSLEERSDAKVIVEYILNESLDEITTGNIYASNDLFSTLHRTSMDIDGDNSPEFVAITSTDELAGNILSINQDSNELYVFGTHNVPLDSTYRKATDENGVLLFEFHNSYLSYEY